jgi:acyl-CoA dehydrogenase
LLIVTKVRPIFSDEHNQFRETVRRFYQKECVPNLKEWKKAGKFPAAVFRKAAESGIRPQFLAQHGALSWVGRRSGC